MQVPSEHNKNRLEKSRRQVILYVPSQLGIGPHKKHWSRHPDIAWQNASKELDLTGIETDIIRTHMFPLTIRPPKYREGAVVTLVDKGCSVYEFFKRKRPYPKLAGHV